MSPSAPHTRAQKDEQSFRGPPANGGPVCSNGDDPKIPKNEQRTQNQMSVNEMNIISSRLFHEA